MDIDWVPDPSCDLWNPDDGRFFPDLEITPLMQGVGACVPTTLAMLTGAHPSAFMVPEMNTQDPRTWSDLLAPYGMGLAYVPCDVRRLEHYLDELVALDDAFLLSYCLHPLDCEPDERGKLGPSHVVLLYRDMIYDARLGTSCQAEEHSCRLRHTKRIFRVVPRGSRRGSVRTARAVLGDHPSWGIRQPPAPAAAPPASG